MLSAFTSLFYYIWALKLILSDKYHEREEVSNQLVLQWEKICEWPKMNFNSIDRKNMTKKLTNKQKDEFLIFTP